MTIKNDTNHVVVVKNQNFAKEIAIGDEVVLNNQEIKEDYNFEFSFFSFKKAKNSVDIDIKHVIKGTMLVIETESDIPVITKTNVENCEKIILNESSNTFLFLYWKFRTTNLKRIVPQNYKKTKLRKIFSFYNLSDKKTFLRRVAIEGVITLFVSILLFERLVMTSESWTAWLIYAIVTMCFFTSAIRKLLYYFFARLWKVNYN